MPSLHLLLWPSPYFHQSFILSTDASNYEVGEVLSQVQQGEEWVIAYGSHVLTCTERKWSTYDKELWVIVWSVSHFRLYLSSNPFQITTDHRPLLSLRKMFIFPSGRCGCWTLEFNPYDPTIMYIDGKKHKCNCHVKDALVTRGVRGSR